MMNRETIQYYFDNADEWGGTFSPGVVVEILQTALDLYDNIEDADNKIAELSVEIGQLKKSNPPGDEIVGVGV
jgi:hypothetical protein